MSSSSEVSGSCIVSNKGTPCSSKNAAYYQRAKILQPPVCSLWGLDLRVDSNKLQVGVPIVGVLRISVFHTTFGVMFKFGNISTSCNRLNSTLCSELLDLMQISLLEILSPLTMTRILYVPEVLTHFK